MWLHHKNTQRNIKHLVHFNRRDAFELVGPQTFTLYDLILSVQQSESSSESGLEGLYISVCCDCMTSCVWVFIINCVAVCVLDQRTLPFALYVSRCRVRSSMRMSFKWTRCSNLLTFICRSYTHTHTHTHTHTGMQKGHGKTSKAFSFVVRYVKCELPMIKTPESLAFRWCVARVWDYSASLLTCRCCRCGHRTGGRKKVQSTEQKLTQWPLLTQLMTHKYHTHT